MIRRHILLLILLIFLGLIAYGFGRSIERIDFYGQILPAEIIKKQSGETEVWVGENKIWVELADTAPKRSQGLSGRQSLEEDKGMLFIFEKPGIYAFWMKDMKFPLDFIWISDDKIVDITENVPPLQDLNERLPAYQPRQSVDKVLEVNAGWVERHKIKIGEEIKIINNK